MLIVNSAAEYLPYCCGCSSVKGDPSYKKMCSQERYQKWVVCGGEKKRDESRGGGGEGRGGRRGWEGKVGEEGGRKYLQHPAATAKQEQQGAA